MRLHRDKRQLRGRNVVERIFVNTLQTTFVSDRYFSPSVNTVPTRV